MKHRKFPATLTQLYEILEFVRLQLIVATSKFNEQEIQKIEIAIEEAVVNIIKHSQIKELDFIEISCRDVVTPKGMEIILKDNGIFYNPTEITKERGIEKGCGLLLISGIMDHVSYQRNGDFNELFLFKKSSEFI